MTRASAVWLGDRSWHALTAYLFASHVLICFKKKSLRRELFLSICKSLPLHLIELLSPLLVLCSSSTIADELRIPWRDLFADYS
jgi:hypothetical protein